MTLRSFHEVRHVRVLGLPHRDRACRPNALLRRVFLRVLDKEARPRVTGSLGASAMLKGLLDNRFEVGRPNQTATLKRSSLC